MLLRIVRSIFMLKPNTGCKARRGRVRIPRLVPGEPDDNQMMPSHWEPQSRAFGKHASGGRPDPSPPRRTDTGPHFGAQATTYQRTSDACGAHYGRDEKLLGARENLVFGGPARVTQGGHLMLGGDGGPRMTEPVPAVVALPPLGRSQGAMPRAEPDGGAPSHAGPTRSEAPSRNAKAAMSPHAERVSRAMAFAKEQRALRKKDQVHVSVEQREAEARVSRLHKQSQAQAQAEERARRIVAPARKKPPMPSTQGPLAQAVRRRVQLPSVEAPLARQEAAAPPVHPDAHRGVDRAMLELRAAEAQLDHEHATQREARREHEAAKRASDKRAPNWWPRAPKPIVNRRPPPDAKTVAGAEARLAEVKAKMRRGDELTDADKNDAYAILELRKIWEAQAEAALEAAEEEARRGPPIAVERGEGLVAVRSRLGAGGTEAASLLTGGF